MLGETLVTVTGSAGGSIDNAKETATFNSSTLSASKTELKALSQKIEWNGVFPTEAFQMAQRTGAERLLAPVRERQGAARTGGDPASRPRRPNKQKE